MSAIAEAAADLRSIGNEHLDGIGCMAVAAGADPGEIREWSEEEGASIVQGAIATLGDLPDAEILRALVLTCLRVGFVHGAYWKGSDGA